MIHADRGMIIKEKKIYVFFCLLLTTTRLNINISTEIMLGKEPGLDVVEVVVIVSSGFDVVEVVVVLVGIIF